MASFAKNIYILYLGIGGIVGLGFGLIYVPAIVSVGYYFDKRRPLAMGIAVCGSGFGTFLFAPINRYLLENNDLFGSFFIKAGIIFNICACAMVMRPLPIEPSEILKRKKKLEKIIQKKKTDIDDITFKSSEEKSAFLEKPHELTKIVESSPCILNDVKTSGGGEKADNFLQIPGDGNSNQFFKSLPAITDEEEKAKTHEDELFRSYSSLNMLAHMRSNKNIADDNIEIKYSKANSREDLQNIKTMENLESNKTEEHENKSFDLTLLLNFVFMFFALSNFLTSLGFNAPYIFITSQAVSYGISPAKADYLLQTIGISNTIGRIILGKLSEYERLNRLYIYATVITICGLATIVEPFLHSFPFLMIYAAVFGFTSGGYVALTALLLVDLLGLENLSNAFGILLVFQGVATAIGKSFDFILI